jgi:NAD(P)-dependent dehydrogenase (short-subunit alcohol dehydrogenase family)
MVFLITGASGGIGAATTAHVLWPLLVATRGHLVLTASVSQSPTVDVSEIVLRPTGQAR